MSKTDATPAPADSITAGGSYPYYSLKDVLKLGEAVHALGGSNAPVPKSAMAHHLQVSEKSSGFAQQIAAARQYGMIEGRKDYRLTEDSKMYFLHTSEEGKRVALLKMLVKPPVFLHLVKRYQGAEIPKNDILTNVIQLAGVKSKVWATRVAALFMASVRFAGAVDAKGILRYDSTLHLQSKVNGGDQGGQKEEKVRGSAGSEDGEEEVEVVPPIAGAHSVWTSKDDTTGATVRLEIRGTLTYKLWHKLKNEIDHVLKLDLPDGGGKRRKPN